MKNISLKIGVLILFFSLMGGFVLYKMGFFEKKDGKYNFNRDCGRDYEYNALDDTTSVRLNLKEEDFEFPIDQYNEEDHINKDIIHSTKSLRGNSGIRVQDFFNKEGKLGAIKEITEEEWKLRDSSKSQMSFDSNEFKNVEKELKIKSMMSTSKSVILIEPLPIPKYKVKIPIDTAKKIQIGSSKSIRIIE